MQQRAVDQQASHLAYEYGQALAARGTWLKGGSGPFAV